MALSRSAILVDTHIVLWLRAIPTLLRRYERDILATASSRYFSIVSAWEISILITLGRAPADDELLQIPEGFEPLPHCKAYSRLPLLHRDPFDRMLVAQAQSEGMPLLTRDRAL